MSRILRRPMFRGGPIDSRGTGITSGLAGGGRVGYQPGGIVTLQDILAKTGAPMTGQQILDFAQANQMNLGPNFKINPKSKFIPEKVDVTVGEDIISKPFSEILREKGFQTYEDEKSFLGGDDKQGTTSDVLDTVKVKLYKEGKVVKYSLVNPVYTGNQGEVEKKLKETNEVIDLSEKVCSIHAEKQNDIEVRFDATEFTPQQFNYIAQLSEILANDEELEVGEFELGIFTIKVNKIKTYEEELIKCER